MNFDVCVIGTGAAGGILAYRLVQAGLRTVSVDAGGRVADSYFTGATAGEESVTDPYSPFTVRASQLFTDTAECAGDGFSQFQIQRVSGLQNLWGGVSLRFSPADFGSPKPAGGGVAWPITYDEIEPYYSDVEALIGVTGSADSNPNLPDGVFIPPLPFNQLDRHIYRKLHNQSSAWASITSNRKAVETRRHHANHCRQCGMCQNGCSSNSIYKFGSRLLPHIETLPNYRLLTNVVAEALDCDTGGAIIGVRCFDKTTRCRMTITAAHYVLSAGAIENPALLLKSANGRFPAGLANSSGLVGRHLMDNPNVVIAALHPRLLLARPESYFGYGNHLIIPAELISKETGPVRYLADIYHGNPQLVPMFRRNLPRYLPASLIRRMTYASSLMFVFGPAQSDFDNRVEIRNGRTRIHYRWTDRDRAVLSALETEGRRIAGASGGVVYGRFMGGPGDSIHYAGTCRMSAQREVGVVDADLRAFDHHNLYICDGSVFPALPEKHSALTVMALASRLSAHLEASVRTSRPPLMTSQR